MLEQVLDVIPLRSFLDTYLGPAFILCSSGLSHTDPTVVYGNPALHSLVLGGNNTSTLDNAAFFGALCDTSVFRWLCDPSSTNTLNPSKESWNIDFRPSWLNHEQDPLRVEFTTTPIQPPKEYSDNKLFVFIASPDRNCAVSPSSRDVDATEQPETVPRQSISNKGSGTSVSRRSEVTRDTTDLPSSLLYTFPWEKTALGPQSEWPQSLKHMVRYVMATAIPTTLYWSWPDLVMVYNDAYAALIGPKHPSIYGQKASIAVSPQRGMVNGPEQARSLSIADKGKPPGEQMACNPSARLVHPLMPATDPLFFTSFTESGHPREVYHTWNWTPIFGQEDGSVGGILNSTYDTTGRVIAERRGRCITDFIAQLAKSKTHDEVSQVLLNVLSEHDIESKTSTTTKPTKAILNLVGVVGIPDDHPAAPRSVEYTLDPNTLRQLDSNTNLPLASPDRDTATMVSTIGESHSLDPSTTHNDDQQPQSPTTNGTWPFLALFSSGETEIINPLPPNLTEGLHKRSFGERPSSAALIPIPIDFPGKNDGPNLPHVVLVVGLNTRLSYDESYAKWLESIAVAYSSRLMVALQMEVDAALARQRERLNAAQSKCLTWQAVSAHLPLSAPLLIVALVHLELRTPLTLIQAPLEQLSESKGLTPSTKGKVDLAMRNVERLRRLVESILDVSKLEAGQVIGRFRPVQLDQIIVDMASLFRGVAERKGIELHTEVQSQDSNAKPSTYIDIQLWEKIFYNLLSNAFKYTKAGKVTISVSYDSKSTYLRVSDTGIGIPAAKQDEIFELFQRVNDLPAEGSGIGLAVAKELVNLHGGKLSVSSRAESEYTNSTGSTFTVELPLGYDHLAPELVTDDKRVVSLSDVFFEKPNYRAELDTSAPELEISKPEEISASMFFNQTDAVLIVDNDQDMRSFLRSIFAPYMTVLDACDGVEALEVVRDILMPRLNGPEFLSKLRTEKKTMFIPVIFVTAVTDNTGLFADQAEGIVDCITKPFSIRDLLARSHLQLQIGKRRIKLENDFTERSSELQTLTNLSPVGIFRADTAGRLTYTNPKWYQVTGYDANRDRDEWLDHVHSDNQSVALQAWRECLFDGKSSSIRLQWVGGVWTQFDIAPLVTPEGDRLGALGTTTDITALHRLEQTRIALAQERERVSAIRADDAEKETRVETERRKAQELLIDVASHELRQPVSAILQNSVRHFLDLFTQSFDRNSAQEVVRTNMKSLKDALMQCSVNNVSYIPTVQILNELDDDIQALNNITQCGQSQERIANDILSLSKIQLDGLSILPVAFELKGQVEQTLSVFNAELVSKGISRVIEFGQSLDTPAFATVFTDLGRLSQIVTNLMSNAIRFTEMNTRKREIKVFVDVSSDPPIDGTCLPPPLATQPHPSTNDLQAIYIYMSVQDSGPGLQKEDLALLFHRFQQGSNDHHVFGGSGLDLFVCRHLCDLLGGRVEVQSSSDGATLRFFIRATKPPPPSPVRQISASSIVPEVPNSRSRARFSHRPSGHPLRVLITEDNKVNQTITMRQMKRAGFTATLASNGAEAVQAVSQAQLDDSPFDVILMDLQMPMYADVAYRDGFAAAIEIRRLEETGSLKARSFIIAVTGNARAEQMQHARDSGVDEVVIKVLTPYFVMVEKAESHPSLMF
ncbi:hypothetical protein FRC07_000818 [Ceratobasidium sp. 392]|nr:hypothetical protein FRC07_000818 [Ceratobasidium sp. 392]